MISQFTVVVALSVFSAVTCDTVPMLGWSTASSLSFDGCATLPDTVAVTLEQLKTSDSGVAVWFIYDKVRPPLYYLLDAYSLNGQLSVTDITKYADAFGSRGTNYFSRMQASMKTAPHQIQKSVSSLSNDPAAMARQRAGSEVAVMEMTIEELPKASFTGPTFVVVHLSATNLANNDVLIDGAVSAISQQGTDVLVLVTAAKSGVDHRSRQRREAPVTFGADSQGPVKHYIYFNGTIFMGLMAVFLIVFFVMIGSYGILLTQTQDRFADTTDKPLIVPN